MFISLSRPKGRFIHTQANKHLWDVKHCASEKRVGDIAVSSQVAVQWRSCNNNKAAVIRQEQTVVESRWDDRWRVGGTYGERGFCSGLWGMGRKSRVREEMSPRGS